MCLGPKPFSTSMGITANLKKKRAGKKSLTRRKLHSGSLTKQVSDGLTNASPGMPRPHAAQIEPGSAGESASQLAWSFDSFRKYRDTSTVHASALLDMPRLQEYSKEGQELRSLPWRLFINRIFSHWHGESILEAFEANRRSDDATF